DLSTGYRLRVADLHLTSRRLTLRDIDVRHGGLPVLHAREVDVDYVLRDLFPGGRRRWGLAAVVIDRPHLYLIRRPDGTFNITIPKQTAKPRTRPEAPLVLEARLTGGTIDLIDAQNLDPQAHDVRIDGIHGHAQIDLAGLTRYFVDAQLLDTGQRFPIHAAATIDAVRKYAIHRVRVPDVPLRGLGNFLINSGVALIQRGDLRDLDLRFFALNLRNDVPSPYHIGGSARLDAVGVKLDVLTQSVQGLSGRIIFDDDAIVSPRIVGGIGKTPLVLAGGMYDFGEPKFRLAVQTHEDLRVLHRDFNFLRTEPLSGDLAATTMLEGPIGDPLILADATGPHVAYKTIPIRNFAATIAYHRGVVFASGVKATVGAIETRVAARFLVGGKDVDSELVLAADAPAGRMPYLDRITPRAQTHITLAGSGLNLFLDTHGVLSASGGGQSASTLFSLSPRGVGELGAFTVRQAGGGVDGAFVLDREHGTSALWANATGLQLFPARAGAVLEGVDLPAFPPITGRFDGKIAGVDVDQRLVLLGHGRARDATFMGVPIADARADFGGPVDKLALGSIDARGEFGHFTGRGALRSPGFAFAGNLDGTLQGMRRWTGDLGALGSVTGPVLIVSNGPRTLVQTPGVALSSASVHGVPLQRIAGTFAVEPSRIVVYAASADVAGGRAVARGDSQRGIRISTSGIDASRLRGAGLPLARGAVFGAGDLRLDMLHDAALAFDADVALQGGNVAGRSIDASAKLRYANGTLGVDAGTVALADALGFLNGTIDATARQPRFDMHADIGYADLGKIAHAAHAPVPYLSGTVLGNVRLRGTLASPAATASLRLPV
ncbi:MAG: hypothetical protein JOY98_02615, partial [Candidatus Eremiobacteraeota bacterium]|nr:hypothetical protein [Candidatus Eremiobacteraeota bacterium]